MEKQSIGELLKNILVPLIFITFGVLFIFFSWGGMELTYDNFYNYIYKNGIPFIFSLFFMVFVTSILLLIIFKSWFVSITLFINSSKPNPFCIKMLAFSIFFMSKVESV